MAGCHMTDRGRFVLEAGQLMIKPTCHAASHYLCTICRQLRVKLMAAIGSCISLILLRRSTHSGRIYCCLLGVDTTMAPPSLQRVTWRFSSILCLRRVRL